MFEYGQRASLFLKRRPAFQRCPARPQHADPLKNETPRPEATLSFSLSLHTSCSLLVPDEPCFFLRLMGGNHTIWEKGSDPFRFSSEWVAGHSLDRNRFALPVPPRCCPVEKLLPQRNFPRAPYDVNVMQQEATPFRSMTSTGHMFPCLSSS